MAQQPKVKFMAVIAMFLLVIGLGACSDTPRKAADNIRDAVPALADSTDEDLQEMMKGVCHKVNNLGILYYANSMSELGLSNEQARVIGLQSSYVYCSENIELFDN
jgi:hypothetical protein